MNKVYEWENFYNELAHKILDYKNNRKEFIEIIQKMYQEIGMDLPKLDNNHHITDIDPFTFFGLFNKSKLKVDNRIKIISAIAKNFNIKSKVPTAFDGIPTINNLNAVYYNFNDIREEDDIDHLWELFALALQYTENRAAVNQEQLFLLFDKAVNMKNNGTTKITSGLYWISPSTFISLDSRSIWYIYEYEFSKIPASIRETLPHLDENKKITAKEYFEIIEKMKNYVNSPSSNFKNFKEISDQSFMESEKENQRRAKNSASIVNPEQNFNGNAPIKGGINKIYYGIPGCGKSKIAADYARKITESEKYIIRTTFYPDYTNSDFIGQIIPKIDDSDRNSVVYDIQSGPFTEALALAYNHPEQNVCLIIEEINRGNAAAIFGDIFQLLDRLDGESEYGIRNYIMQEYLNKKCSKTNECIKIPSNLTIIGTMNTSDQNVFTLDTAFKRRWTTEHIANNVEISAYKDEEVPVLNVKWKEFVKKINAIITENANILGINGEDKQIGSYFISGQEWKQMKEYKNRGNEEAAAKIFAEKVLSYLWEDVAKLEKTVIFKENLNTFDAVMDAFLNHQEVLKLTFSED